MTHLRNISIIRNIQLMKERYGNVKFNAWKHVESCKLIIQRRSKTIRVFQNGGFIPVYFEKGYKS